jgi:hypothetical protein
MTNKPNLKKNDDLLFKYYNKYLKGGFSYEAAERLSHEELESSGIPYEEHYKFSLHPKAQLERSYGQDGTRRWVYPKAAESKEKFYERIRESTVEYWGYKYD